MRRLVLVLAVALALAGCADYEDHDRATPTTAAGVCAPPATYLAHGKPSPCLTPGVTRSSDPAVICVKGAATRVRAELTPAEWSVRRAEVMRRYQLLTLKGYTVDHLLPLEGGGSNAVENLWPEQQVPAKGKDRSEAGLHAGICKPGVDAAAARRLQDAYLQQWGGP